MFTKHMVPVDVHQGMMLCKYHIFTGYLVDFTQMLQQDMVFIKHSGQFVTLDHLNVLLNMVHVDFLHCICKYHIFIKCSVKFKQMLNFIQARDMFFTEHSVEFVKI